MCRDQAMRHQIVKLGKRPLSCELSLLLRAFDHVNVPGFLQMIFSGQMVHTLNHTLFLPSACPCHGNRAILRAFDKLKYKGFTLFCCSLLHQFVHFCLFLGRKRLKHLCICELPAGPEQTRTPRSKQQNTRTEAETSSEFWSAEPFVQPSLCLRLSNQKLVSTIT